MKKFKEGSGVYYKLKYLMILSKFVENFSFKFIKAKYLNDLFTLLTDNSNALILKLRKK